MGFRLPRAVSAKRLLQRSFSNSNSRAASPTIEHVPKGCLAVYVGEESETKRFVIPVSYLNHSSFQELMNQAKEEFGFDHLMGGLTILCTEEAFAELISRLKIE